MFWMPLSSIHSCLIGINALCSWIRLSGLNAERTDRENALCAVRLYKRLEIEWDLELVPSIKDMQKYNSLATAWVIVSYRQRTLPDNMIIWEQNLSVKYTVQAVNVFVTLVSDNYCILRNHLAIIQLVSLFQPLSTDSIM